MKKMRKKGVAPIIATVLLIAIVVVLASIIFLWARGFIQEVVMKEGKNAEQACGEIDIDALVIGSDLQIINNGNIPVHSIEIRKKETAKTSIQHESIQLEVGGSTVVDIGGGIYDEIEIIPAVLGTSKGVKKIYTCLNNIKKISGEGLSEDIPLEDELPPI